jgi:hypothetical protein
MKSSMGSGSYEQSTIQQVFVGSVSSHTTKQLVAKSPSTNALVTSAMR